mgnify:CR=1 FL=1
MPTVTVIIPVYKVERYLDACVESVVRQSYADLEILLVDDGSPDRCPALCDAWAEKDPRIKAVCPPRATPASTPPWASFCCSLTATTY